MTAANPEMKPGGIIDTGDGGKVLVDTISDTIVKDIDNLQEDGS